MTGLSRDGRFLTQGESAQAGQAGDGSSLPIDATGTARVMLERAFPQAGQQAQNTADGQGVAQNTAAPVVESQLVYSDIALADYMAKQAARQKFGDATRSGAEIQQASVTKAEVQPELEHTATVTPEENVVASEQNNGTIDTEQRKEEKNNSYEDLLKELDKNNVKYNLNDIVAIVKTSNGSVVWLEKGNSKAGLEHIMQHADQFVAKGISKEKISDFIMYAVQHGKIIGMQRTRAVYEVVYEGKRQRVAISIGDNGFIVGANPKSAPENKENV